MLRNEVAQLQPGTTAKLTLLRDGKEQTVNVTLGRAARRRQPSPRSATAAGNPTAASAWRSSR